MTTALTKLAERRLDDAGLAIPDGHTFVRPALIAGDAYLWLLRQSDQRLVLVRASRLAASTEVPA